jgi:broad specificity phosphatase PhoE
MIKIYIISNGETNFNKENLIQPDDTQLNTNGKEQATKTGKYLNNRKNKIDFILSSPLERCKETAEIIAKEVGYTSKISYDTNLSDITINDKYKNLTKTEFKNLENTDENVKNFYKFKKTRDNILCPIEKDEFILKNAFKNDVNESEVNVKVRLNNVINTITKLNVKNVVIITHNKIIKLLIKTILKILSNDIIINDKLNCSITYFIHEDGNYYLLSKESNKHLDCV